MITENERQYIITVKTVYDKDRKYRTVKTVYRTVKTVYRTVKTVYTVKTVNIER